MSKRTDWRMKRNWKADWIKMGFSETEADMMLIGSTFKEAIERQGKVFYVGYVGFPQALSAEHAIKLYEMSGQYNGEPITEKTEMFSR